MQIFYPRPPNHLQLQPLKMVTFSVAEKVTRRTIKIHDANPA